MVNRFISGALVALMLGTLSLASCAPAAEQPPLQGAKIGGPFTLTDQNGNAVRDSDFAGKYRLMYFGYSFCPDVCPVDLVKLMAGLRLLEKSDPAKAAKIQPMFITVDPKRDTPAALKPFVESMHPRLLGLTGTPDAIDKVAKEFLISYKIMPPPDPKQPDIYLVSHAQFAYLMDPDGKPLAMIPLDDISTPADEGTPPAVRAELDRWVQ